MDDTETEKKLILDVIENNSSAALVQLFEKHQKMFYSISQRILAGFPLESDDFASRKLSILFEAVKSFDSNRKVKFSTWLYNCIRFSCLNAVKHASRKIDLADEDVKGLIDKQNQSILLSENSHKSTLGTVRDMLVDISDENIKKVIQLRYFSNDSKIMNYSQIAKKLNVTPQTALNWHNKFIKLAKKKLTQR